MRSFSSLALSLLFVFFSATSRDGRFATSENAFADEDWGFFAHQKINRLAVFTLPGPLGGYFKKKIDYLGEHATDPDKRRYAVPGEAKKHYIDLDRYGSFPFEHLPRHYEDAQLAFLEISLLLPSGDTLPLVTPGTWESELGLMWFVQGPLAKQKRPWSKKDFTSLLKEYFISRKGELKAPSCRKLKKILQLPDTLPCDKVLLRSFLDEHGILPYHLVRAYWSLVRAFELGDEKRILKQAADLGHYIADAHVPLHTTENYDGQLTGQEGIHAFWESRLPELFSDRYDFFVGPAEYIEQPADFFWQTVFESHSMVDSVLEIERQLRAEYPQQQRYGYEERGGVNLRTSSRTYALAYHQALNGMVERRMRAAIRAVGSIWYTAFLDAKKKRKTLPFPP